MNITPAKLRRLIPASAVALVLAVSYMAPLPTAASSTNNCGVKGSGYHDHGKVCPNRPFPGQGNGITKFTGTATTQSVGTKTLNTTSSPTSEVGGGTLGTGKGKDKSHAKGHGQGHGNS